MPIFPAQDLHDQKICESYQKLLQIYNNSLILNGSGSQIQFLDVTSSYALNCNCNSNCNCLTTGSTYPITSSWALNTITASYALSSPCCITTGSTYPITSSWALNTITASYALNSPCCITTGSTYPITSSWAINTLTSSYVLVSNVSYPIKTVTDNYTIGLGDYTILCNASTKNLNIQLPSAASSNTQIFNIKKIDTSGYNVHVTTTSGNYIDFDITQSIAHKGTNMCIQSDGTQYWIL